jgi:endonuclease YncB( thermonuclease family)
MSDAGLWRYRAALVAVTDADTIRVEIDGGFGVHFTDMHLRLLGLNAPEVHGPQREAGLAARAYVQAWCQAALDPATAWPLLVETVKDKVDKFGGRYLARVYRTSDGACLNTDLLAARFALPWDGQGVKPT